MTCRMLHARPSRCLWDSPPKGGMRRKWGHDSSFPVVSPLFFLHAWTGKKWLQYLNHIKSVQGSHAYGQGPKAAGGVVWKNSRMLCQK